MPNTIPHFPKTYPASALERLWPRVAGLSQSLKILAQHLQQSLLRLRRELGVGTTICGTGRHVGMALIVPVLITGSVARQADAGVNEWTSIGPHRGGIPAVRAVAIDPDTPATLYAATEEGVFKSTNSGGSWSAVNAGLPTTSAFLVVVIAPHTPTTSYAGNENSGVFKSTDSGGVGVPSILA